MDWLEVVKDKTPDLSLGGYFLAALAGGWSTKPYIGKMP